MNSLKANHFPGPRCFSNQLPHLFRATNQSDLCSVWLCPGSSPPILVQQSLVYSCVLTRKTKNPQDPIACFAFPIAKIWLQKRPTIAITCAKNSREMFAGFSHTSHIHQYGAWSESISSGVLDIVDALYRVYPKEAPDDVTHPSYFYKDS